MDHTTATQIADSFRLGRLRSEPTYVARGAMGEVWRVETVAGCFAVKELFAWAHYPSWPADVDVQLAAADAGVRLPRPIASGDHAVVTVGGHRYRAYEWADVGPPFEAPVAAATAAEAGLALGRIHSVALPLGPTAAPGDDPVDDWYRSPPSKDRLVSLTRAGMEGSRPWAPVLIAMFGAIDELLAAVSGDHGEPVVCHRDFGLDNVRPAADGSGLVVLDWENTGPLSPDQELAGALVEFATGRGVVDTAAADAVLAGYATAGGAAQLRGATSFAMVVHTALNYARVLMEQSLDDALHRDFAEATLADVLSRYLPNLIAVLPVLAEL